MTALASTTAPHSISPLSFEDNVAYLDWEMRGLHQHLDGFVGQAGREASWERARLRRKQTIDARRRSVANGADIPFDGLSTRFRLSPSDEDVLMMCLSASLDHAVFETLMRLQGVANAERLHAWFVAELTSATRDASWLGAGQPLVRSGLLAVESHRSGDLMMRVSSSSFVADAVRGRRSIDHSLHGLATLVEPEVRLLDVVLSERARRLVDAFVGGFFRRGRLSPAAVERSWNVVVSGPMGSGKSTVVEAIAAALQSPVVRLAAGPDGLDVAARHLALANASLHRAVLHLDAPAGTPVPWLVETMRAYPGLTLVEVPGGERVPPELAARADFSVALDYPTVTERLELWESLLRRDAELAPDVRLADLARTFELTGGQIKSAVAWAEHRATSEGDGPVNLTRASLEQACEVRMKSGSGEYTRAGASTLTLANLVLPDEPMTKVTQLLDAARCRMQILNDWGFGRRLATGRGLTALFSGKPGTGKTLCAEVLAQELGMELAIVNVPDVVSKWVGETDRNVREVFSQARAQNALLLFDEADSLFGSRVKVEKAQDHYANMQVNNLLQEIERFDGIVLLTTNLDQNMDPAFARRILYRIEFPEPAAAQRARIWEALIPRVAPRDEVLDFAELAEAVELTGGQIKNAVMRAAYQCCAAGMGLSTGRLLEAACEEARASGRLVRVLPV